MNQEQMRKHFEYWVVNKRGYSIERFESAPRQYVEQNTHIAWQAWRDAINSLTVDLPMQYCLVGKIVMDAEPVYEALIKLGIHYT